MKASAMIDRVQEVFGAISENRYLKAVSKAMVATIPLLMAGAICTLLNNIPIDPYQQFLSSSGIKSVLMIPIAFTTNILGLSVAYFVTRNIVRSFDLDDRLAGFLGIVCFLILTPLVQFDTGNGKLTDFISFDYLGSKGMFVAIIVGLIIGRLYAMFMIKKIYLHMPPSVPDFVERSFAALIPFFCLMTLTTLVAWGFTFTPFGSIHQLVYSVLQVPLQGIGGSIGGIMVAYVVMNLFWWFGIHGKALVFSVVSPIWGALSVENMAATNAGLVPPHLIDLGFTTIFFEIGGAGCILGLAILFTFAAKSDRYKTTGKLTLIPTFFGINEPITFGTPVVLNMYFLAPTILAPLVCGGIGYAATVLGFIPPFTGASLPTGVPTLLNAVILAGWQGLVVQIVCILASIAIYYPFFRAADRHERELEGANK